MATASSALATRTLIEWDLLEEGMELALWGQVVRAG
jgi:hypothetical protein